MQSDTRKTYTWPRWLSRLVGPKSDGEILADLAGHALAGMLANPEWMALAKEECRKPGNGDVPNFFAISEEESFLSTASVIADFGSSVAAAR